MTISERVDVVVNWLVSVRDNPGEHSSNENIVNAMVLELQEISVVLADYARRIPTQPKTQTHHDYMMQAVAAALAEKNESE